MSPVSTPLPIPFPGSAAGPSPWLSLIIDAIGALGAAGAAVVAVLIANRARQDAHEQRKLSESLDGKRQAAQVTGKLWLDDVIEVLDYVSGVAGRAWKYRVRNGSSWPVTDLQLIIQTADHAETQSVHYCDMLLPGKNWDEATKAHALTGPHARPVWTLFFTDCNGTVWRRTHEGALIQTS